MSIPFLAIQAILFIYKQKLNIDFVQIGKNYISFKKSKIRVNLVFHKNYIHLYCLIGFIEPTNLKNLQVRKNSTNHIINWDYEKVKTKIKNSNYYLDEKKLSWGNFATLCMDIKKGSDMITIFEMIDGLTTKFIELRQSCSNTTKVVSINLKAKA